MKIRPKTDSSVRCSYCHDPEGHLVTCLACKAEAHLDCWDLNDIACPSCGSERVEDTSTVMPLPEIQVRELGPSVQELLANNLWVIMFLIGIVLGAILGELK